MMLTFEDGSRMLEHRFIMEAYLGRKILPEEIVHHVDGNGLNNSIDNLELQSIISHNRFHGKEKTEKANEEIICPQCGISFKRIKSRIKWHKKTGKRTFCSHKCSGKFYSDRYWKGIAESSNRLDASP